MTKFATVEIHVDEFDFAILSKVQRDNQLSHGEIGADIGLSTSAVRRRLRRMTEAGVIHANSALLENDKFGVTLVVEIGFVEETVEIYDAFDCKISNLPNVQQSFRVAGDHDYVLIVHAPSVQWYEHWMQENIMADPNIRRANTKVVWSIRKFEPHICFDSHRE